MQHIIFESIGYLASVFLALSLIVNNDLKFRWINGAGCFSFAVYGILIQSYPILLTNMLLFGINLYYLIRIYQSNEDFELIEFKGDERLVYKFLEFYKADLKKYFPNYVHNYEESNFNFVVLRNLAIANIFVGKLDENGDVDVKLNYTVEKYRDFKVGKYIFDTKRIFLESKGVKTISYKSVDNKNHAEFLKVMGFQKIGEGYVKVIEPFV